MNKPENIFPYEMRKDCEKYDTAKNSLISQENKKVILDKQEVQKVESMDIFDYECESEYEYYDGL